MIKTSKTTLINEFTIIVPARLASTRLPNKALADINGEAMIVCVLRRAADAGAARVLAATDSEVVAEVCRAAGFEARIIGECNSGSDRVAAAADDCGLDDDAIVVNLQGDEPFIEAHLAHDVADLLANRRGCCCATIARPLRPGEHEDNNVVKVVADGNNNALYFSRAAMAAAQAHLGVYAYRMSFLRRFVALPPSPQEKAEKLEQLRILWHGEKIALLSAESKSFGIDTPDDLSRARMIKNN